MDIQTTTLAARTYLVQRQTIKMQDIQNPQLWQGAFEKVHGYVQASGLEIAGPGVAVYFAMDPQAGTTDFGIGHQVTGATEITDPDLELAVLAESQALTTTVQGDYSQLGPAHQQLWQHCEQQGLNRVMPVIEEYQIDAMSQPDPKDWVTQLFCLHE